MGQGLVSGMPARVCVSPSLPAPLRTISAPYFFRTLSSIASRAASFFRNVCCFQRAPVVKEIQLAVLSAIQTGRGDTDQTYPDAFGEEPVGTRQKVPGEAEHRPGDRRSAVRGVFERGLTGVALEGVSLDREADG